jgi:hypothetical protein
MFLTIIFKIFLAIQIAGYAAAVLAVIFERRDPRFEGARLIYEGWKQNCGTRRPQGTTTSAAGTGVSLSSEAPARRVQ